MENVINVAVPGGEAHCSYCDSPDLVPYKVKYWKCQDCGRIVVKPIIVPSNAPTNETV